MTKKAEYVFEGLSVVFVGESLNPLLQVIVIKGAMWGLIP